MLCLISEAFTFVYYALLYDNTRVQLEFMLELFRMAVLFVMCNFYIKRASNLLKNKTVARNIIMTFYWTIAIIFVILGLSETVDVWSMKKKHPSYWADTSYLCSKQSLVVFRTVPVVMIVCFLIAFTVVRHSVLNSSQYTLKS